MYLEQIHILKMATSGPNQADPIIQPAPAQATVTTNQSTTTSTTETHSKNSEETNESRIKNLMKELRTINNVCASLNDFVKFQENIPPETRVIIESSYWVAFMYGLKAATKTMIDDKYMDITEPSQQLKQSMEKAYTSLDTVSDSFSRSMKDIIATMKNHKKESRSKTSILDAMTEKHSNLPE